MLKKKTKNNSVMALESNNAHRGFSCRRSVIRSMQTSHQWGYSTVLPSHSANPYIH